MKKNIKFIIGMIIGMIFVSGISVYATLTYSAGDISYTKSGTNTPISVSSALNELYQNKKETTDDVKNVTSNGSITLDKYYKHLNVNVPIPAGYLSPSGTKTITTKANNIDVSSYQYADTTGMYTASEYQNYGNAQYLAGENANANAVGYKTGIYTPTSPGVKNIDCGFEPKLITVLCFNNGTNDTLTLVYDKSKSQTQSFYYTTSGGTDVFTLENSNNVTQRQHISAVSSNGFGFYASSRTYYWSAYK